MNSLHVNIVRFLRNFRGGNKVNILMILEFIPVTLTMVGNLFQSMTMARLADIHVELNIPVPDPILFSNNAAGDEVGNKN